MRSSLGKYQPQKQATDGELEEMRRRAWHQQGVVMIKPDDVADSWLRQGIINLANRLFGKRGV